MSVLLESYIMSVLLESLFSLVDRYVYYVRLHLYKVIFTIELFLKTFELMFN